jgi:molybdenum cofactor cytidylyltransferase
MSPAGPIPIVLAAGGSSRMGRPKALLDFDGRSCLERVLEAVAGQGAPIVVLGPSHEEIRKRVDLAGIRIALNLDVESGQTTSLKTALGQLPQDAAAFFFMPVDYPVVSAADVARLVAAYRAEADRKKTIFIPSHRLKRGHPVLCRRAIAGEIVALPPGASARDVINRNGDRVAYVDYPEAYVLMDMDTPEDYVRCLEAFRARKAGPS